MGSSMELMTEIFANGLQLSAACLPIECARAEVQTADGLFPRDIEEFCDSPPKESPDVLLTKTQLKVITNIILANSLTPNTYSNIFQMLGKNLFRTFLPPTTARFPKTTKSRSETIWPRLKLFYDFFFNFLKLNDFQFDIAKDYIDQKFIRNLVNNFQSEVKKERKAVKSILLWIYSKITCIRPFIKKEISDALCWIVDEAKEHVGIAQILGLIDHIADGCSEPLDEEYRNFLLKVLMPLYKLERLTDFKIELSVCVDTFLSKDPQLYDPTIRRFLKYWPKANTVKEKLFLTELDEILERIEPKIFEKVMIPLFKRICNCVTSSHSEVVKRALNILANSYVIFLIMENKSTLLPVVLAALDMASSWDMSVVNLINNVKKGFMEIV